MFVINWNWSGNPTVKTYIFNAGLRSRTPYTSDISKAKKWLHKSGAERFLSAKDPLWASKCIIEEFDYESTTETN